MKPEKFAKASPEKQLSIINAGFHHFGNNGYEKTSMKEIADTAGVSKSLLFHYFGTKWELYEYLFQFSYDEVNRRVYVGTDDYFECLRIGGEIKMEVIRQYPSMYEFMISMVSDDAEEVRTLLLQATDSAIETSMQVLFSKVNWSKFKEGLTPREIINMTTWISNGVVQSLLDKPVEEIFPITIHYLDLIKRLMYKEEYL